MSEHVELDRYVDTWWLWFASALFLLLPLDLLTTIVAVSQHGTAVEANPITRLLLERGLVSLTVVNLFVAGLAVYLFYHAIERFRQSSAASRRLSIPVVTAWLAVLNVAGVVLVVNNLSAIV